MRTVTCPHCGRKIAVNESDQILQCVCGKAYKNPFIKSVQIYNGYAQEGTVSAMSTDDILTDLLILRGALYRVHETQNEVNAKHEEINNITSYIDGNKATDEREWDNLNEEKREELLDRQDAIKKFFSWRKSVFASILVFLLAFLLPAFGIAPYPFSRLRALLPESVPFSSLKTILECSSSYDYMDPFCWGILLALIIGVIAYFICRVVCKLVEVGTNASKKRIKYANMEIDDSDMEDYEDGVKRRNAENKKYSVNIVKLKQYINELNSSINGAMSCLESEFGGLLHTSDWGNIDYLIYLFMTGRADSKKEALQLLDKEKRTDRIVGAINGAAKYISKNISSAMNSLGDRLSSKMSEVNRSLSQINSSVRMSIATQTIAASCAMTSNQMLESIRKNTL